MIKQAIRARDVIPHEWSLWCSVGDSEPFENEICLVKWSEDGLSLWFMLESFNFLNATPDKILELVPHKPGDHLDMNKIRADHAVMLLSRPKCQLEMQFRPE